MFEKKCVHTTDGDIFYFTKQAETSKPTLVFLHGLSSNHTTWLSSGKKFGSLGYGIILVDMRGHGYSDKRKKKSLYTIPRFAEDLKEILQAEHVQKCILAGYSYGGEVALEYAVRYTGSVDGLVLVSTNMVNPLVYRHIGFLTLFARYFYLTIAALFFWQSRKVYHYYQKGEDRGYWQSVFGGLMTMPISINMWMLTQMAFVDYRKSIQNLTMPTVLVGGSADPFLTQREINDMKNMMQNAYMVSPQVNGHHVATNAQEKIEKIISDFLQQYENSNF